MVQFYSSKQRKVKSDNLAVIAESLDVKGQGVAHYQGKIIFITDLFPGEQAQIQFTEEKRQFAKAKVSKRLTDSLDRVAPFCRHFGICGGCQQQHVTPALQRAAKISRLEYLFQRETGSAVKSLPVITGSEYGYRRRARFGLQYQHAERRLHMGFRQSQSNVLVELKMCPVLQPELEKLLLPVADCLNKLAAVKHLGHVELVNADNGVSVILRHLKPLTTNDKILLTAFARRYNLNVYLVDNSANRLKLVSLASNDSEPYYSIENVKLTFDPQNFIQVNPEINKKMVAQALDWLALEPQDRVLDLFCGMGNFTLPIARHVNAVVGVEGVAELVAQGRFNASLNQLTNVVEFDIDCQLWAKMGFNKILLDPARAGAMGVMPHIIKFKPERVVYISCNPTTLVKDSQQLLTAGYQLMSVRMLDMFPHTSHLESMALFCRDLSK
ncbi:23S rRNA (uracil(1939)-C(5))-methyltransferase RlmD [Arsenophonus sp. PmNCSU2021_1]|uniref:23S rRNA (uracil(1939)-C(5))-methyltransferase RlmD n=1 Tax=Arsenophonus sp. PmNCSU2021_1 TaxID=3118989 RepID=UPI002FF42657